eukprot:scaffold400016_cov33-Prasinocladus_malaysianus.AAC.1
MYVNSQGQGYQLAELFTTDNQGRTAVKTPKVLEEAAKFFNCQTLAGVPLHADGSHWDADVIRGDIMTPDNWAFM